MIIIDGAATTIMIVSLFSASPFVGNVMMMMKMMRRFSRGAFDVAGGR
jgi:hypothetical protein